MRGVLIAVLVLATACAGGGASAAPGPSQDVITASELAGQAGTARQAIQRLRPGFLRVRGPSSINVPDADRIVVYIDNARMGGVEMLDQIMASDAAEIRYMSAPDATSRYGTGHSAGAIIVTRR